jgi:hypothetical protein
MLSEFWVELGSASDSNRRQRSHEGFWDSVYVRLKEIRIQQSAAYLSSPICFSG